MPKKLFAPAPTAPPGYAYAFLVHVVLIISFLMKLMISGELNVIVRCSFIVVLVILTGIYNSQIFISLPLF